jgi:hypothetical protein
MRTAICAVTSFVAMTCLPGMAAPPNEEQRSSETTFAVDAGTSIDIAVLDSYRAGAQVYNSLKPDGLVENNTAINVATGMNSITEGAFANASGLPIAIQNSGANVLIQNATIINVQLQ